MKLLLIGCGNIGGSLLQLWTRQEYFTSIVVVEPSLSHADEYVNQAHVKFVANIEDVARQYTPDITVLAIKPQHFNQLLPALRELGTAIMISLMAGVRTDSFEFAEDAGTYVIRIMPNLALKYGQSMNMGFCAQVLPEEIRANVETIFVETGKIVWLDNEDEYNYLVPIASSGPAYFLLLAQLILEETIKLGVKADIAQTIVQQTLLGTASLIENNNNYNALIASIKSKGGVTEAAINILRLDLAKLMHKAIAAAIKRGQELHDESSS